MIIEFITYLWEKRRHPHDGPFGHLVESISLRSKEKRCRENWLPHLKSCKNFIMQHCQQLNNKNTVVILGSGPLHEIPIDWLSQNFNKVILVDIIHLQSTKKSVEHLPNLTFVEHDISELEESLAKGDLTPKIPVKKFSPDCSIVISANILSQIPLHLERYIDSKLKKINLFDKEAYLEASCNNHLLYLKSFSCPVLLYCDGERLYKNAKGEVLEKEQGLPDLSLLKPEREWSWDVSPINEVSKGIKVEMKVSAYVF
jgi:hypothetical protein